MITHQTLAHPCAVCDALISKNKLMCLSHWKLVPKAQQQDVNRAFALVRVSSGGMGSYLRAQRLYNAARDAAIASAQAALEAPSTSTTGAP